MATRQINNDELLKQFFPTAWNFYQREQKFKSVKKQYEELKAQFEADMLELAETVDKKRIVFEPHTDSSDTLVINKIEKTSIEWDAEKLERKVSKRIAKKVIKKRYTISNMSGLARYLDACGVDPKEFKSFLTIERTVDIKAVEQLGNVGELSVQQISGCYIVKCNKPYFTLSVKRGTNDGEEE